jgi:hypothetical protein
MDIQSFIDQTRRLLDDLEASLPTEPVDPNAMGDMTRVTVASMAGRISEGNPFMRLMADAAKKGPGDS